MRGRLILAVAAPLLVLGASFAAAVPAAAAPGPAQPSYYLALGDSLSVGFQPTVSDPSGRPTDQGYVNDLYAALHAGDSTLRLVKLGCPGETSTTMISGGICSYPGGRSQLGEAVHFLRSHRGRVSLITIDIGANNVDGCIDAATLTINAVCVGEGIAAMGSDLPVILETLGRAAPGVAIVGMNYYDPFLAAWLEGAAGQVVATESEELTTVGLSTLPGVNSTLDAVYSKLRVPVADVQDAFQTTNFNHLVTLDDATVPENVALICAWTWMCAPSPYGPNIHANDLGYAVIAGSFLATLRDRHMG